MKAEAPDLLDMYLTWTQKLYQKHLTKPKSKRKIDTQQK